MAPAEHTVTAMLFAGPATFLAVAARTVLTGPDAAEAYLVRLRHSDTWFDQLGERLRAGAGRGGCRSPRWPSRPSPGPTVSWPRRTSARCCPRSPRRGGTGRRCGNKSAGRPPRRWCGRPWHGG